MVDLRVTTAADETPRPADAQAARRRRKEIFDKVYGFRVGVSFPLVLLVLWDRVVFITGTRLIPTPAQVGPRMYVFPFGGSYDDAYSRTVLLHMSKSLHAVYGGFFPAPSLG